MANTANNVITPQNAILKVADLSAISACVTRGPTATAGLAAANIVVCVPTCATDTKISKITIKGDSTSITATTAAQLVGLWYWNGATAYLFQEIVISAKAASTTTASFETYYTFDDLVIPAGCALYVSTTIATTTATTALCVLAHGASM
jgi:hypothetical protein